jgi:hypothetical protein
MNNHTAQLVAPCAPELAALLACFATTGDLRTHSACAAASKTLHKCMMETPRPSGKKTVPSVSEELSGFLLKLSKLWRSLRHMLISDRSTTSCENSARNKFNQRPSAQLASHAHTFDGSFHLVYSILSTNCNNKTDIHMHCIPEERTNATLVAG